MMTIEALLTCLADYRARAKTVQAKYPFYDWACKNVKGYKTRNGNVAFRKRCLELAKDNDDYSRQLWIMCSRDILFWINTVVFTYDPRLVPKSSVVPFITYYFQDVMTDDIKNAIDNKHDELTEKSRTMGASWLILIVFVWMWTFREYNAFRVFSRNEMLVDKTEDPDSLFWKILFMIEHQPKLLKPNYNYTHLHIKNLDNNSTIDGCTTTSDAAAGGRCTAMLLDEFGLVPDGAGMLTSTRDVTKCRIFNSTHRGAGTAFYKLSLRPIAKLTTHWSLHPLYNQGLYYSTKDGQLVIVDKDFKCKVTVTRQEYDFPDTYPFRKDGKLRSPWYDNECDRAEHPMEIAQELDMDPFASDFQYFTGNLIPDIEKNDVRMPYHEGILTFDDHSLEPLEFIEGENGQLKLWIHPDAYGKLPEDLSVVGGFDVAQGTGASNSTATFVNSRTGEKIAEYANPKINPEAYASEAIAMCNFFNEAFMIPDASGAAGQSFCNQVLKLGYRNIYYRRNEEGLTKNVSDKPGVFLNPAVRTKTLGEYRLALKNKVFIQRSHEANQECMSYIYIGREVIHSSAKNSVDPSGAGENHGDRVIADALACKGLELLTGGNSTDEKTKGEIPPNCYAARKRDRDEKKRIAEEW